MMRVILLVVSMLFYVAGVTSEVADDKLEPYQSITVAGMKRYEYFSTVQNWTNAHQVCTDTGGHLAMPTSDEEAVVILDMMTANGVNQIHIGFNDVIEEGNYVTNRGVSMSRWGYKSWALGTPPSDDPEINCGSLIRFTTSGLASSSCSTVLQHVCEYKLWDDYNLIPGFGYYKLHIVPSNWQNAYSTCRAEGSDLLIFNSVAEKDAVIDKYASLIADDIIYYGVHHMFANQNFITVQDEPLTDTGFSNWAPGEPGTYNNVLYPVTTLAVRKDLVGSLFTLDKTSPRRFICKHGLHDIN